MRFNLCEGTLQKIKFNVLEMSSPEMRLSPFEMSLCKMILNPNEASLCETGLSHQNDASLLDIFTVFADDVDCAGDGPSRFAPIRSGGDGQLPAAQPRRRADRRHPHPAHIRRHRTLRKPRCLEGNISFLSLRPSNRNIR